MYNERSVKIIKCDNGWILEWKRRAASRYATQSLSTPSCGLEVYIELNAALDRAKSILA